MSDIKSSINQVIEEQNIPFEWSQVIFDELENICLEFSDSRVDLTKKPFVTIDGKDAKDFDDAVLCEKNVEGFSLWVAIADVAEVVNKNSEIDKEAFKRGTSIYFPNTCSNQGDGGWGVRGLYKFRNQINEKTASYRHTEV